MSGYLEAYGAAEEKHARQIRFAKISAVTLVSVAVIGLILYAFLKNYSEEQRAKTFISLLQAHNYQEAYRMWGCTDTQPCRDYRFEKFMEDWGPNSPHADAASAHLKEVQSCGDGVLLQVEYKNAEMMPLYIDRGAKVLSFAPWQECPGTKHLRISNLWHTLFGR